jgi:hypothetical protein
MTATTKIPEADVRADAQELEREGLIARIPGWLRAVAVIGLVAAIALYWSGGLRWVLPWGPSWVGAAAGFLVIWAAFAAAVELLHRNRRHLARRSARAVTAGGLGIAAGSGAAWRGSLPLRQRVTRWAGQRWHQRHPDKCAQYARCPFCDPTDTEQAAIDQAEAGRNAHVAAEIREATAAEFPERSYDDLPDAPASGATSPEGDHTMGNLQDLDPFPDSPERGRSVAVRGGTVLALFRQLANAIAEAEPETHEELVALMADGINGFGALAKGYVGLYEHCRDARKLSQASVGALEDVADAVSDCMTAQAYARQKYLQAYEPAAEVAERHGLPVGARQFFDPGEA